MPCSRQISSCRQAWALLVCALSLAGCASRGSIEVLESELRRQEQVQDDLTGQLMRAREELKVAQSDAAALRTQLAEHRQTTLSPDQAILFYRAEALKFNMLLTSGHDRDGQPGDEGLSVLLYPVDVHGDLVKLAGAIELELFDMTLPPDQQRLGEWKFSPDDVREHWHKGFLSGGYLFRVDWLRPPVSPELTLHARMAVPDGRQFDATTQVKVTPPGGSSPVSQAAYTPASRTSPGREKNGAVSTAGRAKVRLAAPPGVDRSATAPPRIRSAHGAGHAEPPTQTSDNWTDETIPRLR